MILRCNNKNYEFKENCPEEVINIFKNSVKEISYDLFIKYKNFWPKSKKWVKGKCNCCNKETKQIISKLIDENRLNSIKYKLICKNCIMGQVAKDENWLIKNSNAQKIAQNNPETKKKNSDSLKKTWSNKKIAYKWIEGIRKSAATEERRLKNSLASKKMWQKDSYRNKQMEHWGAFNGVSGVFCTKNSDEIRFDSVYEFFFLFMKDLNCEVVKRFNGSIEYYINDKKTLLFS